MATSRISAVIDALVTMLSGAAGLAGVAVYDGPVPTESADPDLVIVGDDDDPSLVSDGASASQDWASLGAKAKDELGSVNCAVIAQNGGSDIRAARIRAFALLTVCEDTLRTDPTLGGVVAYARVAEIRLAQASTPQGVYARIMLTLTYKARI